MRVHRSTFRLADVFLHQLALLLPRYTYIRFAPRECVWRSANLLVCVVVQSINIHHTSRSPILHINAETVPPLRIQQVSKKQLLRNLAVDPFPF